MSEQINLEKNNFYRDNYRRVMFYLIMLIGIAIVLTVIVTYQTVVTRKPAYYATTTTGRVIPLQSLDMPVVTDRYLLEWASLAVRAAYNLNFEGYANQLNEASQYFTTDGWSSLMNAMNESNVIDSLKNNKLIMASVLSGPAIILAQDIVHGRYTWRVQLPLLVTYTSANEERRSRFIVTIDVIRVPVLDAAKGIQINQFNAVRHDGN